MSDIPLIKRILDAGYPKSQMFHHYSDLYVFVTPLTTRIVEEWCKEHGYSRSWHCPKFKDLITGRPMYDCAFQFIPSIFEESTTCEGA